MYKAVGNFTKTLLQITRFNIMNSHHIVVLFVLVLTKCSLLFGALTNHWESRPNENQGRIVGGHEAMPHSNPYMVSLQLRFLWVRTHFCGGTLLNKYWVLTAGHCIKESWIIRWLPMDVVAGTHDVDKFGRTAQVATVSQRIHHPRYNGGIGPNDIALLRTSTPFEFTDEVQPAYIPTSYLGDPDDALKLIGWGVLKTTFFFPDLPGKLQEANVTYIPYDGCYKAIEAMREGDEVNPLDKKANICTGPLSGGIAGCSGDSGGPLVAYVSSQKYYNEPVQQVDSENHIYNDYSENDNKDDEKLPVVLGVVSWGISPCGKKGAPTVYTKVSNYLDFINQYIKI